MLPKWGIVLWFVVATAAIHPYASGTAPFANNTIATLSGGQAPSSTHVGSLSATSYHSPVITSASVLRPTEQRSSPSVATDSVNSTDSSTVSGTDSWTTVNSTYSQNLTASSTSSFPCTVNIPNAKLEWWYAAIYSSALGTLTSASFAPNATSLGGKYFTVVSGTNTFDVSSAITDGIAWTESVVHDSVIGDWINYEPYTVRPTAATTSIITRNGAKPLPSGNIIPAADTLSYMMTADMPPASITIAGTANATSAVTSATPFLYFTAYEIESAVNGTTTTSTVNLPEPSATEYWVKGIEDYASASGTVPDDFLKQTNHSTCGPGTFRGEVTVLVVLDLYWDRVVDRFPFLVHIESSALGFEETDTDKIFAAGTSIVRPFTAAPDNPKWTEDLGKTTRTNDQPRIKTADPQPTHVPQQTTPAASSAQHTVGAIGTNPIVVAPSSVVVVGTQTLKPGAPAVTIDGSKVSVAPSATAIVVGGTTSALPIVANPGSPAQTIGTVGGRPIVLDSSSAVVIGTATIKPGQPPVTIGGTVVSVASSESAIFVGGKPSALPHVIFPDEQIPSQAPAAPVLTIGSSTFTANAATQFFVNPGKVLTPGGTAIVDGTLVSLGPSAYFVVIGGSTQLLPTGVPGATARPEIVVGGITITALPGSNSNRHGAAPINSELGPHGPTFVISGQTLEPGHVITAAGTTISLASAGFFIVVNGVTSTLSNPAQVTPPPITIGGSVYTPLPGTDGSYMLGTSLLTPGGEIVVSGTTISLASDGWDIVVNGVTASLHEQAHATITNPPLLTIGAQTYTAALEPGTTFIIGGQTLTPGGTITVDGTTIVLAPGATELVYGSNGKSTTESLFPATTTRGPFTTGSVSAPASAGATEGDGRAAATSSTVGAGVSSKMRELKSWTMMVIIGVIGLWLR